MTHAAATSVAIEAVNHMQLSNNQLNPVISVVLPACNAEKYVRDAVRSILCQSFASFELIAINDGSSDSTQAILQELREQDPRIVLISRENKGLVESLNEGIDLARGKWIARMDADDIALPHRFERQLQWLEQTGADICGSWVRRFGTSDKRVVWLSQADEAIKMKMLFGSPFAHPTVMMRAVLVKRLRYESAWEKAEDYDLWERAVEAGWAMTNVPEVLLLYRIHTEQISAESSNLQQQLGLAIRRRYWEFVFRYMRLDQQMIDEVMKMFVSSSSMIDMDAVDASFTALLRRSDGEARDVLFSQATRLYFKVAASCPDIASRWGRLNLEFGVGRGDVTKCALRLFRLLRIRADGNLFARLRKLYVLWASQ